jgi:SAM-dependent methyltransferase
MCHALRGATNVYVVKRFAHNPRPHRNRPPAMHEGYRRLFASQAMQALLKREMAALTPILSGVYGNSGLFLGPPASAHCTLPTHLLGNIVELAPTGDDVLDGDVKTTSSALAFANDSFQLVVAQHSLEFVDDVEACASEFSRVLAPEGVALVLGFNPFGSWRPWLAWQAARGARLSLRSSSEWQQLFARNQIETLQVRHPGVLLPNDPTQPNGRYAQWLTDTFARFGSSWLLLARKRRSTLTPLRLRTPSRERALNPRLAPGAHRACA